MRIMNSVQGAWVSSGGHGSFVPSVYDPEQRGADKGDAGPSLFQGKSFPAD